jgi:hypothetical protein
VIQKIQPAADDPQSRAIRQALRRVIHRTLGERNNTMSVVKGLAFQIIDTLSAETLLEIQADLRQVVDCQPI